MNVTACLEPIINKSNAAPGDYTGADGLLYCGKCHTPKQMHGEGMFAGRKLPILCSCMIEEKEKAEREDRARKIEELRKLCLPVEAMRGDRFELASEEKQIRIARRYVRKWDEVSAKNIGLLFWGGVGTGKSFTAHCIANALIDRGVFVRIYSASELVKCMGDRETHEETVRRLRMTPLLIVDDVGAERATEYALEQLCAAIDERSEARKPLIVTTNYTLDELRNCKDRELQRIFDRLSALCTPVAVVGESRRKEIGESKLALMKELLAEDEGEEKNARFHPVAVAAT